MSEQFTPPSIVVGIDGSRTAVRAALWAIDEAVSRDVPLRLVGAANSPAERAEAELAVRSAAAAVASRARRPAHSVTNCLLREGGGGGEKRTTRQRLPAHGDAPHGAHRLSVSLAARLVRCGALGHRAPPKGLRNAHERRAHALRL